MKLIAILIKEAVQNDSTTPPTLEHEYKLRIVPANDYHQALEIIAKDEIWETLNTREMNRVDYLDYLTGLARHYERNTLLYTSFTITFKELLLGLKNFIIKKNHKH